MFSAYQRYEGREKAKYTGILHVVDGINPGRKAAAIAAGQAVCVVDQPHHSVRVPATPPNRL